MDNTSDSFHAENDQADSSSITWSRVAPVDIDDPKSLELSAEFVGRWSTLVSTTNWEKGRIICEWRDALMGSESPAVAYSDEAWSRRVGGVSPQHVGRLRRVFERFGLNYNSYAGVYWSHFLAALDWDDAELWLEGATQSGWSVSNMRRTRWESMGGQPDQEPDERDISADGSIVIGVDDDYTPLAEAEDLTGAKDGPRSVAEGPRPDGPDFGDEDDMSPKAQAAADNDDDPMPWEEDMSQNAPSESPFARLPSLPVDLAEALEQFKLAIIRHRTDGWSDISQADVHQALDALKAFVSL
ncbi:MAG: hypothetical protein ABI557_08685 [Aureliella sp.]